jgi:glycosyltransferase involved in cell wall biosynthesis
MHYAVPRIFERAGMLERFFTDSYSGDKPFLRGLLAALPRKVRPHAVERWLGRAEPAVPPRKVVSFETFGWRYARAQRRARDAAALRRVFADYAERFDRLVLRHGLGEADAVYGFNGAALELFEVAKARGLRCIVEQTIAPQRFHDRIVREELARWPGWQPDLVLPDGDACPLAAREEAEWAKADLILCGSPFVVEALRACGGPAERCVVVPYGVDPGRFAVPHRPRREAAERLRVLFVGEVGLRKGAPDLLEALRQLGPGRVEARLVGGIRLARERLEPYAEVARFEGAVPRSRMRELFAWADVFVLPSLCEGSATATYEALAAGLPVVATPNTGSVVRDGVEGHLVPIRAPEAIAERLDRLASDRESVVAMSEAARSRAGEFNWDRYGERLVAAMRRLERPEGTSAGAETAIGHVCTRKRGRSCPP